MAVAEQRGTLGESRSAVSAAWIAPKGAIAWIVVAHGAGAGMDHPFLAGFCRAMADEGVGAARFNFHYMNAGRRSPDPEPALRAAWMEAFDGVEAHFVLPTGPIGLLAARRRRLPLVVYAHGGDVRDARAEPVRQVWVAAR